jgi:MFS family permease
MQPSSDTKAPDRSQSVSPPGSNVPKEAITLYHWMVVLLAALGWLFDCMGQRIFVLSREPALKELLGAAASDDEVRKWGGMATLLMMVGWATGGVLFGVFSDRYGRVKAMVSTLLAYTVFSGLSGFAHNGGQFLFYRFLFGLGVGGMFGAATTLVAESVPARFRTMALGTMQSLSALGTMAASALSLKIIPGVENYWGHFSGWQVLCFAGVLPAILAVPMVLVLREPEPWKRAKVEAANSGGRKSVGSLADLFQHPRWRHNLLIGVCLGVAGMVGLWGIAFFSPELITTAFKNRALQAEEIKVAELCAALKTAGSPPIAYLKTKVSPEVVRRLEEVRSPESGVRSQGEQVSPAVSEALVTELNRLIQGESLYDAEAFRSVNLKKGTKNLVESVQKNGKPQQMHALNRQLVEQSFPGMITELSKMIDRTKSRGTMFQDLGAVLGMFSFTFAAAWFSRRTAFLGSFALCLVVVALVFSSLRTEAQVYWMLPLMGFATLSCFAGYSIYFPEIFPTRLRGTGVGFCYNTVRYLAAPFPFLLGWLSTLFPFRGVAVAMCSIYLIGIVALLWAPETKGRALPED